MTCKHERYKTGKFCTLDNALRGMRQNKVCWIGVIVKECEDCGEDISKYEVVPYKSPEDYMRENKLEVKIRK